MVQAKTTAEAVEESSILDIINSTVGKAEKASRLTPIFLQRQSFAKTATSTGSLTLDFNLGGGIPPSRIVGIVGPEGAGKTLLAWDIMFQQLLAGRVSVAHDAEGSTDPLFLKSRGHSLEDFRGRRNKNGDLLPKERDSIFYYQPTTGDEVLNYMHTLMYAMPENRNPEAPPIIFLLDSVVALISDAVSEDVDSNKIAMHAKMYAEMMPIINGFLARTGCSFIYTNQLREGVMVTFGDGKREPAGNALKYFSSIRMHLDRSKPKALWIAHDKVHPFVDGDNNWSQAKPKAGGIWEEPHWDDNGTIVGQDRYIYTSVKTIKNKVYTPFKVSWMKIQFEENGAMGHGIDPVFDIFTFLSEVKLLKKATKGESEKAAAVAGKYEFVTTDQFDPKALHMPERFTYPELKLWVKQNPNVRAQLREKLILSGVAFDRAENA